MKSEEEWQKELTAEQYKVLRKEGTERAFSGKYWDNHKKGMYKCAGCGEKVFSSKDKFESGTGWPSFSQAEKGVETKKDRRLFISRTEVHCKKCGGHLGHVFDDGPMPGGQRYCINSVSLDFKEEK